MKIRLGFFSVLFITYFTYSQSTVKCIIKTSEGNIHLKLFPKKAPVTVANFLRYIDADLYAESSFFRTCTPENEADRAIKIEVIQGGNIPENSGFDPIVLETTNTTKLKHKNGTISMARGKPNSATSSFFICINNQPELDYAGKRNPDGQGFAAFGKVTKGMDVVKKIQLQENKNQYLTNPIKIYSIKRI
jgi:peptidyl-prolyl cis-trans isomerase A (cyclophilin A)